MKKNRGIHKILSMLLCCVMLLGLLPMTALAATITQVTVTIDAPQAGKAPDYSAKLSGDDYDFKTTSASNPFVVNGINWYDETAGNDLTATHKFVAGHTYTATVFLVSATGYQFSGSVSGKINGSTAAVTGNGSEIQVKYTFPALATNQITTVTIEGVTAPATGAAPSYVAIVKGEGYRLKARNDAYYKNGICWSVMESSDLPVSGGTTFEGGQKYQITMYLVAEEGYEFSATAGGALQVKATMNGKTAANAMYTGRLAKDQKAGKDLQPTIDKMNALIDDYDVKSKPLFCAQAGLVDEIVDMPMMRNYIVAFTDACYQNPESICPFHQMLLPRTIKDYDDLKK